jgi:hypothetical protein
MNLRRVSLLFVVLCAWLASAPPAGAHRLDEYLQATLIGVTPEGINVEIRLTPGIATLPVLMAMIDQDRDGRISAGEERAYAGRVAREVDLRVDGVPATLWLTESDFPTLEAMREGLGTIRMKLHTARSGHELRFENHHLPQVSVYLVNCLAGPADGLVVRRQKRDVAQRSIEFEYAFGAGGVAPLRAAFWPAAIGMLLVARMAVLVYRRKHGRSRPARGGLGGRRRLGACPTCSGQRFSV